MRLLNADFDVDEFFRRLACAPARALLLDYDGTIAPFRVNRDEALPYPEVIGPLNDIAGHANTQLVIITGRALRDLRPLIRTLHPQPTMWGSHGWECIDAKGRVRDIPLPPGVASLLERATDSAAKAGFLDRCEQKPSSIALHWRGATDQKRDHLRELGLAAWKALAEAAAGEVSLHEFDGGLELRAAGRTKGSAVIDLLAALPADAAVAYLGDDRTDEDAFAALRGRGFSVLVRDELRPTLADVWIRPPSELVEFLTRWASASKSQRCQANDPTS